VTKNAILIVEFANQLRNRGMAVLEAVIEAARIRLRPILMTSFSTIFGVLPIALGWGAGAEARQPLGIAIVGGMFASTFLTLILVPAVYIFMAKFTKLRDRAKEIERETAEGAETRASAAAMGGEAEASR
jgi:multidrug efflux pump subunit AcrB